MSRGWGWGFSRSSSVTSEPWSKAGPLVLGNSSLADPTSFMSLSFEHGESEGEEEEGHELTVEGWH